MEESDWLRQREGEQNGASERGETENDVRDKKITTVFPIAAIAASSLSIMI